MNQIIQHISNLFSNYKGKQPDRIEKLPQSGSDRQYFRVYDGGDTFIATFNPNIKENKTFIYFSDHFKKAGLPVPEVIAISGEGDAYIQQDLGTNSLMDAFMNRKDDALFGLFKKSLIQLARIQILGHHGLDYNQCLTAKELVGRPF